MTNDAVILSTEEMNTFLMQEKIGRMALALGDKPYNIPLAYVYHDNALYGQTGKGQKLDILSENSAVCFLVDKLTTNGWKSVQCFGNFEVLDFTQLQESEAVKIVKLLSAHLDTIQNKVGINIDLHLRTSEEDVLDLEPASVLFRIPITKKTGRQYIAT